jgi:hypothetical protein
MKDKSVRRRCDDVVLNGCGMKRKRSSAVGESEHHQRKGEDVRETVTQKSEKR